MGDHRFVERKGEKNEPDEDKGDTNRQSGDWRGKPGFDSVYV